MLRQRQWSHWWLLMEEKLLPAWGLMGPVQLPAEPSSPWEQLPGLTRTSVQSRCFWKSRLLFFLVQLNAQLKLSRILAV